ncbi:MAG: hypothetical protein AAFQ27_02270, partial [Pseudomonadota bacterium]
MSHPSSFRLPLLALAAAVGVTAPFVVGAQDDARPPAPPVVSDDFSDLEEAQPETPEVSPEMEAVLDEMNEVITALDAEAERSGNNWQFTIEERMMIAVTDTNAGRMRVITPIAPVDALPEEALMRLMQANFDTALDARYAVGQGLVWGAFIHPLESLTTRDFASGVLQTHTLAETFGTTFSSGALNYGGGDSGAIIDEQLKELLEE